MKKILSIILFSTIFSISPLEAKDNSSIEHVGGDTILSYNGESITIHDEDINFNSQKCPIGYHIGTAEDWEKVIKLRYDIKGDDYKFMNLRSDGYGISESYPTKESGIGAGGLYSFRGDVLNNSRTLYFKTTSYGDKHQPYIFVFNEYKTYREPVNREGTTFGSLGLYTCGNININDSCNKNFMTRCFKDKNQEIKNGYSKEYNDAYIFSYNNKITSMNTIERANMYGEIKRMEFAKMLSNWVKIFGFYQDPNIPCNFTDTASVKGDLSTAIIESCRYGIMGQGITKFRPNDKITRAEVATAISRILRNSKYDGGTPYYINHINALRSAGVISNTSNVKSNELRGNVMVMIMKANDILKYNFIDCETPEYILICADDEEKCPEKCKK